MRDMESPKCCSRCRAEDSQMRVNSGMRESRRPSCYDKFALAKRLHAENLEHQPLPDKVDDSIFKNFKLRKCCRRLPSCRCGCRDRGGAKDAGRNARYGPVLGCKKPETGMDLAICWETPVNPIYEPPKPTHIDGTEGGLAPSIFALVQHRCKPTHLRSDPTETENVCKCNDGTDRRAEDDEKSANNHRTIRKDRCKCCERCKCKEEETDEACRDVESLCVDFTDLNVSRGDAVESSLKRHRKCTACQDRSRRDDPRLIKSAVGFALGTEKLETGQRKSGLPAKVNVRRPRTPFARRSFCIDTLSPPFSVMNGSRDGDYPEHWRLMTIYQQSYKNPAKRRHF